MTELNCDALRSVLYKIAKKNFSDAQVQMIKDLTEMKCVQENFIGSMKLLDILTHGPIDVAEMVWKRCLSVGIPYYQRPFDTLASSGSTKGLEIISSRLHIDDPTLLRLVRTNIDDVPVIEMLLKIGLSSPSTTFGCRLEAYRHADSNYFKNEQDRRILLRAILQENIHLAIPEEFITAECTQKSTPQLIASYRAYMFITLIHQDDNSEFRLPKEVKQFIDYFLVEFTKSYLQCQSKP
jgi:hypothetical protein